MINNIVVYPVLRASKFFGNLNIFPNLSDFFIVDFLLSILNNLE
jgi:hypothetical protein